MPNSALIIDVVDSKKYDNREEIQIYLKNIVNYLNKIFEPSLKKQLVFSGGDEIQGLFIDKVSSYLCCRQFIILAYPVKIRTGIGYGSIDFENDTWISTEIDGDAYHNARESIKSFDNKGSFGTMFNSKSKTDKIINSLLFASTLIQKQQSTMCQNIKLLSELIYPIYFGNRMNKLNKQLNFILNEILSMRATLLNNNHLNYISANNKKNNMKPYSQMKLDLLSPNYHEFEEIINNDTLIINNTWKKGIATKVAEGIDSTRQNVDKHIRVGKVIENRNIDASIIYMLMEEDIV